MDMISKFALAGLLALAIGTPVEQAAAQGSTLGGAIVGGTAGAIVGGALGGRSGAAAGAVFGAATGAAIGAQGEPRPGGYRYYQNGCYVQQGDGSWVGVSPRYCQTVEYAPRQQYVPRQQQYYDDTPACMRYRSYDPRRRTYIGRDGYERPCP
jgi:BA14K-like protein